MPPTLESPPPLPDQIKGQMGSPDGGGFAQAGKMLQGSSAFGGAPNAQGALRAKVDAIKKVLKSVIDEAGPGKQFFSRCDQLLDQAMAAESQAGPGSPANAKPAMAGGSEETGNKMPGSFPG